MKKFLLAVAFVSASYGQVGGGISGPQSTTVNSVLCGLGSSCTVTAAPSTSFTIYPPFTQVIDGNFSWANQASASYSVGGNGVIYLTAPTTAGDSINAREAATPMSTPWSITIAVLTTMGSSVLNAGVGLEVRDSVGGHLEAIQMESGSNGRSCRILSGTLTSWSHGADNLVGGTQAVYFFKVLNNGTNLLFYGSADGVNFSLDGTRALSGFANTPNKVGFFVQSEGTTANVSLAVLSWIQGTT